MKALLVILVVAAGLGYYFFYYRAQPATPPPSPFAEVAPPVPATPTPASKRGFDELTALLRQDMDNIPMPLDGPGRPPANAVNIRRKISPYVSQHAEYQTLVTACDLIIRADSQRSTFQQACHAELSRRSFGTSLGSTSSMDKAVSTIAKRGTTPTPDPKIEERAIHTRVENNWQAERQQTVSQVEQLLASLAGKQI